MINLFQIIACYNEHEGFQRNSKASMKALQNVDSVIGRSKKSSKYSKSCKNVQGYGNICSSTCCKKPSKKRNAKIVSMTLNLLLHVTYVQVQSCI